MNRNMLFAAFLTPAFLYLSACSGDAAGAGSPAENAAGKEERQDRANQYEMHDEDDDHQAPDHVELSPAETKAAGIVVGKAALGRISGDLELPAEIRFDADRIARVSPKVEGVVARLYAGEGDTIGPGATLALLTSRELAGLKADFLNAVTAERLAKAELDREEHLFQQKITAKADVQSARAAFAAANAQREAAENRLHAVGIGHEVLDRLDGAKDGALSQAYVTSPIAGKIIRRTVSLGETVSAGGEPMFVVIDDSVVWADIAVYKDDLGKVDAGLAVSLRRETGESLAEGTIATVLPIIDETSRTATARVIVDNADHRLKPGQFLTAHIETGGSETSVRVPSGAIVEVEGRQSVFVPTDDGFKPTEVMAGGSANGFTQVLSGLEAGDALVTDGAFTLKAQLEKDAFGDGHAH
ncbi:efflux RND transporter periplasmic adaptor subunit [Hyphomonas sp.]|uniref:efflux RND transporter periplasmic adaptor subunit n=1 Tax=Hyphomonas sp. TaxID=87 RepID=UPI003529923E